MESTEDNATKGLSKAQKKKLKAKEKAAAEAAAANNAAETSEVQAEASAEPASKKGAKGKKKKGGNAALAAQIAERNRLRAEQEAEEKRLQEEEEAKEREAERIRQEKLAAEKAAKEAVKKAKKDKIDQLKKEGKWKTKAQMEQEAVAAKRRKALLEQGVITQEEYDDLERAADEPEPEVKKHTMIKNKKKNKKDKPQQAQKEEQKQEDAEEKKETNQESSGEEEDNFANKKQEAKKEVVEEQKEDEDEEEFEGDDWENAVESGIDKASKKKVEDNTQQIQGDDSEEETKVQTSTAPRQKNPKVAKKKKEKTVEADEGAGDMFSKASSSAQQQAERRARQAARLAEIKERQKAKKSKKLRCPIICILGHVDTGKTLILDKLRRTNVQAGEAGGITQQIGATYFPEKNLHDHLERVQNREELKLEIPGFLVIDTPGHESFTNLRSRGSSLCDMAILVVDIMHALEQQTLESIQLLRQKKTPFCVALNKIDRLNLWKPEEFRNSRDSLDVQVENTIKHYKERLGITTLAFNEQGMNVTPYWENNDIEDTHSLVPTSAITGEGLSDLMFYLCKMGQDFYRERLLEKDEFECTVLEVKVIEGHGTTIDVVLVNGLLKVGDTIVISGFNGPIVTNIRALLTPQPMKELRVKGEYQHHQKIKGAMGIKISAPGLENALSGSELFRCANEEEIEEAKVAIEGDLVDILDKYVDKSDDGVIVQASTIGSLEALLEFLYQMKIPVTSVNIGPVHKKDVLKAMKSIGENRKREFATILAFDVKVMPDAQNFAEENGIKVFTANIIYHLFDSFTAYVKECSDKRKEEEGTKAVFPAILEMVKGACFNQKAPIIIGVTVKEGVLKIGTPLVVPSKDNLKLGKVESIELNKKPVQSLRAKDGSAAVKIAGDQSITYGRHFDDTCQITSWITRDSIDALKQFFKDDMLKEDWLTVMKLKKVFGIV